jgi:anti-sigma regulatory factor (Ser/Thr protein kinase)
MMPPIRWHLADESPERSNEPNVNPRAGQAVTPHQWSLRSYLELGALPTAVPCARLHARHLLWEWGLNGLAADTELLVSELVTNAVQAMTSHHDQAALRLRLSGDDARVLIEVWDADPRSPAPKGLSEDGTPDLHEEGGRGLFLVAALSTRWDWYLTQEPPGKVVWCELAADPHRTRPNRRGHERSGNSVPDPRSSPRSRQE